MRTRTLALALLAALAASPLAAQAPQTAPGGGAPPTTRPAPAPAPTAPAPAPTKPAAAPAATLLDINSASKDELDALPGVGPVRAEAIIKGRPYRGKDELLRRKILPARVYNAIKDRIIARQS